MLSWPSEEIVPPQPMAAMIGLLATLPRKCSGRSGLEFLAHHVARTHRLVARRAAGSRAGRQAGDLRVVVRVQEIADRDSPATCPMLGRRIDNAMQVREPTIIGPALHHVADVDDELPAFGGHVQPRTVPEPYLQAAGCIADGKDGQATEVGMLTRSDLVG